MNPKPQLSIVVPHFNQPEQLDRCLASLRAQSLDRERIEIIVCDNGSDRLPTDVVGQWPGIALLSEPEPGPGPARNSGVARSNSDLLAFIDADCTAAPGWIEAILKTFSQDDIAVFGGDVRVSFADPAHPTMVEPYEAVFAYRNREYIEAGYSGTGNLAMRREVFDDVGGFAGIGVAEDRDWGLRAIEKGYCTRYCPDMVIFHPARTFAELQGKWDRHIAHDFALRETLLDRMKFGAKAMLVLISPVSGFVRIIRSDRIAGPSSRWLAFKCLCRIRAYRAWKMARVLLASEVDGPGDWSRPPASG